MDVNGKFRKLYKGYIKLLEESSRKYGGRLSAENRKHATQMALFYAEQTYDGTVEFSKHLIKETANSLKAQRRLSNRERSWYSLNSKVPGTEGKVEFGEFLQDSLADLELRVMVRAFLKVLPKEEAHIARLLMGKHTVDDLIRDTEWTRDKIHQSFIRMRSIWEFMYGEFTGELFL